VSTSSWSIVRSVPASPFHALAPNASIPSAYRTGIQPPLSVVSPRRCTCQRTGWLLARDERVDLGADRVEVGVARRPPAHLLRLELEGAPERRERAVAVAGERAEAGEVVLVARDVGVVPVRAFLHQADRVCRRQPGGPEEELPRRRPVRLAALAAHGQDRRP